MPVTQTRRRLLAMLSMAGAASIVRTPPALGAEGSPETTSVRITKNQGICYAPQYVAEELLRDEGLPRSNLSTRLRRRSGRRSHGAKSISA
jgi:NitT/TauT family transport system substrate-binding protein